MMRILFLMVAIITVFVNQAFAYTEQTYIKVPVSKQSFDLQDEDFDGVINARDACPNTPRASKVDNDGCGEILKSEEIRQLNILFPNNSAEINPIFVEQIKTMANFLNTYQAASIEIQGYASKTGSPRHNLTLSKERAYSVQDRLIYYGINPKRVRVIGYGDTKQTASDNDLISHALNRKVTATVIGLSQEVAEEWTIFTTLKK
ncbi:OmpA family protein [Vibrio sp. 99-70-13A1]|uniref:OmpA family protein n=1 Tax=Vibrio sp. 99-70-13A1 TaxID=2607601 RepID=UPI00149343E9